MEYFAMKPPIESCPTEGWTILNAIANCCPSWRETIENAPSGRVFVRRVSIEGGTMTGCFEELQSICRRGLLNARARRGDPNADDSELNATAWVHYRLGDPVLSTLITPENVKLYDVRLFLPKLKKARGQPTEKPWVKTWAQTNHPQGLPKKLSVIVPGLLRDFRGEQVDRRNDGRSEGRLSKAKALSHLRFFRDFGYNTGPE